MPNLLILPARHWAERAATLVQSAVDALACTVNRPSIMLTGGRSARALYEVWARSPAFLATGNVDYFLGDERWVAATDDESNARMVMRDLFGGDVPPGCRFFPMATEGDKESRARDYEKMLPERVDVLLLSVGEDGHVASLFPGGAALNEESRRVMPVTGPKAPHERLTITPPVIRAARSVFLLAQGKTKAELLGRVLAGGAAASLPVALAMDATWLLDTPISTE